MDSKKGDHFIAFLSKTADEDQDPVMFFEWAGYPSCREGHAAAVWKTTGRGLDKEKAIMLETRWADSNDRRKEYWEKLRQTEIAQAEAARKMVLTFVNSFTTRILGEVRPAFHGRGGSPVVSDLEDPKKDKSQRRLGRDWSLEGARTGISKRPLIDLGTELKDLETSQDEKRKRWLGTDQERYDLTVLERKTPNTGSAQFSSHNASKSMEQHESYQNLCDAKRRADFCYLDWVKDEEHLRELRAAKNALQKIAKMRPNNTQPNTTQPERHPGSQATWTSRCVENRTEFMRIDQLLDGLCPTDSNTTASPRVVDEVVPPVDDDGHMEVATKLPPTHITSSLISDLSFPRKNQKRREERLASDTP
ncbi:hypothetical protein K457DRAFT_37298 [Linnemannia elongata AG-77]|uniref:Uncharacterized protein n=1 Tax=Linnemannia elongata AG-77 TaxID=1314771 RepID=A0A197JAX2_9FUNG|nr:hypothetical protein K457DRAFT_37298 [Linnemannia elongata AG-77]